MNLTPHFSYEEMTHSEYAVRHGLTNHPDKSALVNLHMLADRMERVREILRQPILISSAYRSPAVNTGIGGSKTSAHMQGLAVDFTSPQYASAMGVFNALIKHVDALNIDQLIMEYPQRGGWVHLGIAGNLAPRKQVLIYDGKSYKEA